jgi:ubiquinone/menaquinone biosynthesis C-methylase UbiE
MNPQVNLTQPFLNSPQTSPCRHSGWRSQFACPSGKWGLVAGRLMALKNAGMNRLAVEMLDVRPEDQVLEIGFGHGHAIQMIAERAHKGTVAGIDLSGVMVRQAARRNRRAIMAGRVELSQGSVANIPYEYARFDKVLAVNNYQFWPNAEFNLGEIQRVLRQDGLLLLCLRKKGADRPFRLAPGFGAPGFSPEEVQEVAGLVRWVGFRDVRTVTRRAGYETTCVIARR